MDCSYILGKIYPSVLAVFVMASLMGCGDGDGLGRTVVRGTVSFEGTPLPAGTIRFVPEDGPQAGATITNGRYEVTHKGGVPVGKQTVFITAFTQVAGSVDGDLDAPVTQKNPNAGDRQYLPERYNSKSTLTADVSGKENPTILDFDLTK